ncbi:MAG: OsmC family peroxiredoxin [Gemmatimonadetes bacterium]|nr:OsmC family peroxiredoxin [Gemmatimonadota bacterium]NIQ56162.1 OsmC family peroxiredoxin [Gemmatimonadota bacterium]NIU76349.1 OsmC family peroxiredoxin [Gammaproteobacteria bacterium]NIX45835.1 OsmC family peroxiredoxin [Gemmatimonadota bacterium]NIY10139.1 OsmC family peroxiredoxin [Gemmatimonadota bacterium]
MAAEAHRYHVAVRWEGRRGSDPWDHSSYPRSYTISVDGRPDLPGSADAAFRGDAGRHNPEDLFVAAISACHMLAYLALCARRGVEVLQYADEADGVLELGADGGGRFTDIELRPTVTLADDADGALARALHDTAHDRCFIASSCRVPIRCTPVIRGPVREGGRA